MTEIKEIELEIFIKDTVEPSQSLRLYNKDILTIASRVEQTEQTAQQRPR